MRFKIKPIKENKKEKRTRSETIYSTPTRGALALSVVLVAVSKLATRERREKAIKARRTFI